MYRDEIPASDPVAASAASAPPGVPPGVEATYPYLERRVWHTLAMVLVAVIPFLLTALAITLLWHTHIGWLEVGLLVGFWWLTGLGISIGYHRMLAHGAFEARAPVKLAVLLAAAMSLQGGPATWAATHRRHHARADRAGDPHSPLEGLWHAHFGWLPRGRLVTRGPAYDQLMADPVVRFVERTQFVWMVLGFLLPGAIGWAASGTLGGFLQGVLWGGAVRVFVSHHATWSVNSIGHVWGTRPHDAADASRNNALLAAVSFGEGWHNNHHAFPSSAWIGHRWWQFDPARTVIRVLAALRLVRRVHVAAPALRTRHA